ncbi:transporter [Frateuria soli]|uniref:transporter n=1 Tax=Frateuria soli TaxID=1542730 RepID=UPI001E2C7B3F|nr:transporter [Frateuria soli]UGB37731.1 transporter [Frateuria soli]
MQKTLLATAVACGLFVGLPFDLSAQAAPTLQDEAQVQTLMAQLQALKASYAQQVRQLRELDMQVQALQAKLAGKSAPSSLPAPGGTPPPAQVAQATPPDEGNHAGSAAEAEAARQETPTRSLKDALQQEHALFDRKFTLENSISYARYDRNQITLNGFLALDAIFLGNIAIEDVKSDSLTYNLAARYGVSPRLTLNLDVPYLYRKTVYQKGGAGGSAAAIAEEDTTGAGLGDLGLSANYKLFDETGTRPDTVLTLGITAPTGQSPYGIDWKVLQRDDDQYIRFAVPEKQPTGNGVWQANLGLSAVKTMDPAIIFANLGYIYSKSRDFDDINTDPETQNPGSVKLGNSYYFGAGVAFAFNERTSLSLSFSDKLTAKASLRYKGSPWAKVIGSDANAATFNMGVTHALNQHTTLVSMLGIGLTPDAPDFSLTFKIPYMF